MSEEFDRGQARKGPTFDDYGPNYNDLHNVRYEDHFLMFTRAGNHAAYLQKVIDYADGEVIELACGTGTQALAVEPYVGYTVGIELDSKRVELTYQRGRRLGSDAVFVRGDMFEMPFPDDTFSVAFNSGIFQHFDDDGIGAFLNEATRVVEDYIVLSVANRWHPHYGRSSRRMLSHDYWCDRLDTHENLSLVEEGEYGNRLDSAFRAAREVDPIWLVRWIAAGLPYPRSWFVFSVA